MLLSSQLARKLHFVDVKGKKITQIKVHIFYKGRKNLMKEKLGDFGPFFGLLKKHEL